VRGEDLTFRSGGDECKAWLFLPRAEATTPLPCVVLGHGFDGVREQRLDAYGALFAAAGVAALAFDYRHYGSSGGQPRQLYDNEAQVEDWRAAIACARGHESIDPDRIALWGTSTSAGHATKLAAEDGGIAAVVVQMPLVDGLAQLLGTPILQSLRLLWAGLRDKIGSLFGAKPLIIPAAGRPGSLAAATSADALSGLAAMTPPNSTWRNEVVARFTLSTALYRPGRLAGRLRRPLLVCMADGDEIVPPAPALRLVEQAPDAELRRYPFGHFGMYSGEGFDRAAADQAQFLARHLGAVVVRNSRFQSSVPEMEVVP
jgi:fermentation-respiration switch protein FrsA (DUF1100 family)